MNGGDQIVYSTPHSSALGCGFRARKAGGLELEVQHLASLPGAEGLSPISSGDLNSSSASPLISGVLKEQL